MNPDLIRIRNSRLFKRLPDRAFDRVVALMKVRAFESGDEVLSFPANTEFAKYYGYVVSGEILFLDSASKAIGVAIKDEFFLGRQFTINDDAVAKLVSANNKTFVVFIPKEVVTMLAQASEEYSDMFEEIYESIFDRAKVMSADPKTIKTVQEFLRDPENNKTFVGWVEAIDKKRTESIAKKAREKKSKRKILFFWVVGLLICGIFAIECFARLFKTDFSFVYYWDPNWKVEAYKPGSDFNIMIGIIGYGLILLTNLHTFAKWAIRKLKWKINYQFSSQLHIFFGFLGFLFILLHTSFHLQGMNIANLAVYAMFVAIGSGLIGQFISAQIPKTIRGELVKLEQLKAEQEKLKKQATMLMEDDQMYKTSLLMLSKDQPRSAMGNFLFAPFVWFKALRLQSNLKDLGLSTDSALLASSYVMREFRIAQKVQFLEISNIFFKRWMAIHKPFGYILYGLGLLHIVLAMGWI